jgi:RHS repeat-associated protein
MSRKVTALGQDVITETSGHVAAPTGASVCTTPAAPGPVPIPYPTFSSSREGIVAAPMRTKVNGARVATVGACTRLSHGNEPGTLKELISRNTGGPTPLMLGAPTVLCEQGMMGITGSIALLNKMPGAGARTAPIPNLPSMPGMCPGVFVLGGGGDGGGAAAGGGGAGGEGEGAGGRGGGRGAGGDQRCAPDYERYPECGYASHPVDVVTGRAFTHPIVDLALPGPLPLEIKRMYGSTAAQRDFGLGYGWGHTLGWEIEVRRRSIVVWNEQGVAVDLPLIDVGADVVGPWGWLLRREAWGFELDADDGVKRIFGARENDGQRFFLTAIEDRRGNRITIAREAGRIVEVQDSAGRRIRVTSTREGRIASLQVKNALAQGRWIVFATYTYGDRGDLIAAADADGHTWRYEYDDEHRLIADTDRTGLTFRFVYDRQGRCVESWGEPAGGHDAGLAEHVPEILADGITRAKGIHHCRFHYGDDGYTEVADSREVRRFFGNRHGLLDKRVEGGGVVIATYNEQGHILTRTDEEEATTIYERDSRGRLLRETDPLGRTTIIERDAPGDTVRITDAAGGETIFERDRWGHVVAVVDPTGATTTTTYDDRGLPTSITLPTCGRWTIEHDAHGNPARLVQPNGGVWVWTYDYLGRCSSETDPLGAVTRFSWSDRGDLIAVHHPEGGTTRYDVDGERRPVQITDPGGRRIQLAWGGYHKLIAKTNGAGETVRFLYNREGELVEVRNAAGDMHRREYSPGGDLIAEVTFDGRRLSYGYDLAGRLTAVRNGAGELTELVYNEVGELVERHLDDGSIERFDYDLRGDLVGVTWPAGELRFERDAAGRVVREIEIVAGERHEVRVALDRNGDRVRRATSLGHTEVIHRDGVGARRYTMLDGEHAIAHEIDLLGREVAAALERGGRIAAELNTRGQVAHRWVTSPGHSRPVRPGEPAWLHGQPDRITVDKRYGYDPSRELVEAWDRHRGPRRYQYDPAGRLLEASADETPQRFQYDAAGNRHEVGAGAPVREYAAGGRTSRRGDTTYRWDDDGRLIEKRTRRCDGTDDVWRYTWNAAGLLQRVRRPDGALVELTYDPLGRRLLKEVFESGSHGLGAGLVEHTRSVWDGDTLVHEIRRRAAAAGNPIVEERTYCFDDESFVPRAHRERGHDRFGLPEVRWFYYVNDPSGAPEELVTADGQVACRLRREPWGRTEVDDGTPAGTLIRFQGQLEDPETGLFYNRFRYYDPELGGYISPDPLGLEGGLESFAYAINPLRWIDPFGLTTGIIYLRVHPRTGREYVGRSKSPTTYLKRQRAHNRKLQKQCGNPRMKYKFFPLQSGINPGADLAEAEEDWIRAGGGPGRLENLIHAQAKGKYKGKVPFP